MGAEKLKAFVIVSPGPVPNEKQSVVEGGGLRAWSLAEGLRSNGHKVRIAVPKSHFSSSRSGVFAYSDVEDIVDQVHEGETVIANYAHHFTGEIFNKLGKSSLRIADAYVPIHVEVSARDDHLDSKGINSFNNTSQVWLEALSTADAILVASNEQKLYYTGMLFALKKINPANYREAPILVVPFGIQSTRKTAPKSMSAKARPAPVFLWWGGFYPWFDHQALPQVARELGRICPEAKIRVAGAINPFVREKSFSEPAENTLAELRGLKNVEFIPWVPFSERFTIFKDVDVVLSLNNSGPETGLSWRTRYIDILEQGMPIATNGGDPFGEHLLTAGGGFRLTGSPRDYAQILLKNATPRRIFEMREAISAAQENLTWSNSTQAISNLVKDSASQLLAAQNIGDEKASPQIQKLRSRSLAKYGPKPILMFLDHCRRYGIIDAIRKTLSVIRQLIVSQVQTIRFTVSAQSDNGPLVLLHQLDTSGAPLVGIAIARELQKQSSQTVTIMVANIKDLNMQYQLKNEGFRVVHRNGLSHLPNLAGRRVILNSAALPARWIDDVIKSQLKGALGSATFFIHENEPQQFLDQSRTARLKLAQNKGMEILAVSKQQKNKIENLHSQNLKARLQRLSIDPAPATNLRNKLKEINVILVGPTGDNRKRQLDTVIAVALAQQKSSSNKNSRSIHLTLVGLEDNFLGNEILRIGEQTLLQDTFRGLGPLDFENCLVELSEANVVVSLSENESFGLYIAQAMTQGAIVLRTPVGGHDETVLDQINGFIITMGIVELAEKLVKLADRKLTPDSKFLNMMLESKALIEPHIGAGYSSLVKRILGR